MVRSTSTSIRSEFLGATLLESFVAGIYTSLFLATLYFTIVKWGNSKKTKVLCAVLVSQYALTILHLAISWNTVKRAFIQNGLTANTVLQYLVTLRPAWSIIVMGISLILNIVLVHAFLVYRCFTLWRYNSVVLSLPVFSVVAEAAVLIRYVVREVTSRPHLSIPDVSSTDPIPLPASPALPFEPAVVALSVCTFTTLQIFLLISFRVLTRENVRKKPLATLLMDLMVETSLPLLVAVLLYLIGIALQRDLDRYFRAIVSSMTGFVPAMMLARVSFDLSQLQNNAKVSKPISGLRFGSHAIGHGAAGAATTRTGTVTFLSRDIETQMQTTDSASETENDSEKKTKNGV